MELERGSEMALRKSSNKGVLRPEIKGPLPGPKAKAIIDQDAKHSSPSYIKEYPLVVERGEGPWLYDPDGNRFLDFMAGIATASTGHAHPEVVKAIQDQAAKFLHICSTDFYYESFSALVEKLSTFVPKMGTKRVFLTNSGAEAVEGAIKLVRHHTGRSQLIAFEGGFHGRTTGAVALTASKTKYRAHFGPFMSGIHHVPYCTPFEDCKKLGCGSDECGRIAGLKNLFKRKLSPSEVAAIFVEPVLGEGGYVFPKRSFLQGLRDLCDEHGILLVFDEVQSGAGRTGHMFAAEHFDVAPDIFLSAKGIASGMPIGAIVARESVMTWPAGTHGSTYGGNPVCCAAALATLDIIEKHLPRIRSTGEVLMNGLEDIQSRHPVLKDVRGAGLMVGADYRHPKTGKSAPEYVDKLEIACFHKGLLILPCGESVIRFAPPLIISPEEIKVGLEILEACMTEIGSPS